jgi:hypothetical protein
MTRNRAAETKFLQSVKGCTKMDKIRDGEGRKELEILSTEKKKEKNSKSNG